MFVEVSLQLVGTGADAPPPIQFARMTPLTSEEEEELERALEALRAARIVSPQALQMQFTV